MAFYVTYKDSRRSVGFNATDFLEEGIDDFLESGSNFRKLASCIVKIATSIELIIKEKLEGICPALILENIDDKGLQLIKLYGLEKKVKKTSELNNIEIRTVSFPRLLKRADIFFEISDVVNDLIRLHKIRNDLIHHRADIDVWEVNILLVKRILPFLEKFIKGSKLDFINKNKWKKLKKIEKLSIDVFVSELLKKLEYHKTKSDSLSDKKNLLLVDSQPEITTDTEVVHCDNLVCPACKNVSLTMFMDVDVEEPEPGEGVIKYPYYIMRCRVCEIYLDEEEIDYILENFSKFFNESSGLKEKRKWLSAIKIFKHDFDYW